MLDEEELRDGLRCIAEREAVKIIISPAESPAWRKNRIRARVHALCERRVAEVDVDLTPELLDSRFAVDGGADAAIGDASLKQVGDFADLLESQLVDHVLEMAALIAGSLIRKAVSPLASD